MCGASARSRGACNPGLVGSLADAAARARSRVALPQAARRVRGVALPGAGPGGAVRRGAQGCADGGAPDAAARGRAAALAAGGQLLGGAAAAGGRHLRGGARRHGPGAARLPAVLLLRRLAAVRAQALRPRLRALHAGAHRARAGAQRHPAGVLQEAGAHARAPATPSGVGADAANRAQVLASLLSAGSVPALPKFASSAVSRHVKARRTRGALRTRRADCDWY